MINIINNEATGDQQPTHTLAERECEEAKRETEEARFRADELSIEWEEERRGKGEEEEEVVVVAVARESDGEMKKNGRELT